MGFFTRRQAMGAAALALGFGVFLSRILGLVRDKIISYHFGAGDEADVYFASFVVPDFLNYLLAGGYFSITLVPLLATAFHRDEADGWRFFSAAVAWAFLAIALLTLVAWALVPALVPLAAPGFSPEKQERLAFFLRIILPAQVCFLPGACFSAMLYYRRQFLAPALTPLIYNLCIIAGGLLLFFHSPERGMEGFCWGVPVGAFLGAFLLPFLAVRAGGLSFSAPSRAVLRHPAMKALLLLALPLMLGQSVVALDEQFVRVFGSLTGEGGVSLLNYARRVMLVPVGVVAQAAGLASYPFLAALAAENNRRAFDDTLNRAAGTTLLVALPLSLWMMTIAVPLMRLLFQQGLFSPGAAARSGLLLALMLAAVAFWAIQQIIGRAFYAHKDTLTPALAGTAVTLLALPLQYLGATRLGPPGVALAGTLAVTLYAVLLCLLWTRRFGPNGLARIPGTAARALLLCLPACAAAYGVTLLSPFPEHSLPGAFAAICVSGLAFALLYLGLGRILAPALVSPFLRLGEKALRRLRRERKE
ncbi:MAG: murein biosynthesis integral membrane protein MurJ [Desulfovibrio sp.]|jgi:putative peptidoglycan lipid II flippase|nr:murein biosynthesis integral membrane protein MurJ [Desulfovibrio sp.]